MRARRLGWPVVLWLAASCTFLRDPDGYSSGVAPGDDSGVADSAWPDGLSACKGEGAACVAFDECCSHRCGSSGCDGCTATSEPCEADDQCCKGLGAVCYEGWCRQCAHDGGTCSGASDCCSRICSSGVCVRCQHDGESCDPECCSQLTCEAGKCTRLNLCSASPLPAAPGSLLLEMLECTSTCLSWTNPASCYVDCFAEQQQLTDGCAGCYWVWYFGVTLGCKWCNPVDLALTDAQECRDCYAAQEDYFEKCAGLAPGSVSWTLEDACIHAADPAQIDAHDLYAIAQSCKLDRTCISEDAGVSPPCASCYSSWFECVYLGACFNECFSTPVGQEPCKTCASEKCLEPLKTCTGRPDPW